MRRPLSRCAKGKLVNHSLKLSGIQIRPSRESTKKEADGWRLMHVMPMTWKTHAPAEVDWGSSWHEDMTLEADEGTSSVFATPFSRRACIYQSMCTSYESHTQYSDGGSHPGRCIQSGIGIPDILASSIHIRVERSCLESD